MSPRLTLILAALVLSAGAARARAQFAVYAMGSGAFLGSAAGSGGFNAYGGTFGVYDDVVRLGPVKLGGDLRYFQNTSSNNNPTVGGNKLRGGMIGPRLAVNIPLLPIKPYLQAEIGDVATNYGILANMPNSFAYQIQGGLDFTIFPHLDLRGEYGGGQIHSYGDSRQQSLQEAGLGLVIRFF